MKAGLLIEDRDTGWLFLDTEGMPGDAEDVEITFDPDVRFEELENEGATVFLTSHDGTLLRVSKRDNFNFGDHTAWGDWFPMPTPNIVVHNAEYVARCEE